jgi:perosamine synthetase
MNNRYISLYFASIGFIEVFILLIAILKMPFLRYKLNLEKLHKIIREQFNGSTVFTYTSARGALADFLISLNLSPDDEVAISSFSCLAVPTAVVAAGLKPAYYDINPETMNISMETIAPVLTSKTRVIIVQHTLGSIFEIDQMIKWAHQKDIILVEDCALSIGKTAKGQIVGGRGDAAIFSMELSKILSSGWGGVLVINNSKFIESLRRRYYTHDFLPLIRRLQMGMQTALCGIFYQPNLYWITRYGVAIFYKLKLFKRSTPLSECEGHINKNFISKLGNPQIQLAIHQWKNVDIIKKECIDNADYINKVLRKCEYKTFKDSTNNINKVATPRVPFLIKNRSSIKDWFTKHNIELGSWFDGPLSPIPSAKIFNYDPELYPNALFISKHIVNIPCHNRLSNNDLLHMELLINIYFEKYPDSNIITPK